MCRSPFRRTGYWAGYLLGPGADLYAADVQADDLIGVDLVGAAAGGVPTGHSAERSTWPRPTAANAPVIDAAVSAVRCVTRVIMTVMT